MPRFSIRQLLIATAFIAAGIVALLNATPAIAATAIGLLLAVLGAAVLLALFRDAERRAFWIGFAVIGWLYFVLCFVPIFGSDVPLGWSRLVTGTAAGALHNRLFTRQRVQPQPPPGFANSFYPPPGTVITYFDGPGYADFIHVAQSLWAILFATCGGWFAAWLYSTREKPSAPSSSSAKAIE
jgi:membrane associated rhomboid family serine protease